MVHNINARRAIRAERARGKSPISTIIHPNFSFAAEVHRRAARSPGKYALERLPFDNFRVFPKVIETKVMLNKEKFVLVGTMTGPNGKLRYFFVDK